MKRNWTEGEIKVLKEKKSEGLDNKQIQEFLPRRSRNALNLKSSKLKIGKEPGHPWSEEEIRILYQDEHLKPSDIG
jgi:hypothetical protein